MRVKRKKWEQRAKSWAHLKSRRKERHRHRMLLPNRATVAIMREEAMEDEPEGMNSRP